MVVVWSIGYRGSGISVVRHRVRVWIVVRYTHVKSKNVYIVETRVGANVGKDVFTVTADSVGKGG